MNGAWLGLSLLAICSGCGTIRNLSRVKDYDPSKPRILTYGGVEIDKAGMKSGLRELSRNPPGGKTIVAGGQVLVHAADTPLSFVADTVTFPYCVLAGIGQHYTREIARFEELHQADIAQSQRLEDEAVGNPEGVVIEVD